MTKSPTNNDLQSLSLSETVVKEVAVPTAQTDARSAQVGTIERHLLDISNLQDEIQTRPIYDLLHTCLQKLDGAQQLFLVVGTRSEHQIARWFLETFRSDSNPYNPAKIPTITLVRAFRHNVDSTQLARMLSTSVSNGDVVLFFPNCSESKELATVVRDVKASGALTIALGVADRALPLEQHTKQSVPIGRTSLPLPANESRLFLLLSLIARTLQDKAIAPRPEGFFRARSHVVNQLKTAQRKSAGYDA
ncbi:MAG: hypothetical protein KDD70_13270 [Bdellovibrionales bacterium]|nr:hypothetical protein [Bdellovibrionales bacterium]